jgi:hypothetical protein
MRSGVKVALSGLLIFSASILSSCGKQVESFGKLKLVESPKGPRCSDNSGRLTWQFRQPVPNYNKAVDLLFVTDTSLSLVPERGRLIRSIPHFLKGLPADADPRIAVMLGHGGKSKWSGRLFSRGSSPKVINPKAMSERDTEEALEHALACPPLELASTNGEALLLSLKKSLSDKRFSEIRGQGFFRDGAALSVVFVSDENDVCYDPREHGFTGFPDFKSSLFGLEDYAKRKYCGSLTPESLMSDLQATFPGRKISMGAIVHSDPAYVSHWGEDSIGHGFLELISKLPDSIPMDIRSGDFDQGLSRLASVSTIQLALMTSFSIKSDATLDPNSILVWVDGVAVPATFDADTQTVRIDGKDAGIALSQVDISACPAADWVPPPIAMQ